MAVKLVDLQNGKVELHTSRLRMRGAVEGDAEHINKAFTDPEVMRYWSEAPQKDIDRSREWISGMIGNEQNGVTDFILCLEGDDRPIGKIGVWSGDEIGFLLDRSYWHEGLAKEALGSILPYLFNTRNFQSISADIDPRNEASLGILKKNGFEVERYEEKTLEIDGEWMDSVYLRLTKERWSSDTNS